MKAQFRKGHIVHWKGYTREEQAKKSGQSDISKLWYWWDPQDVEITRVVRKGKSDSTRYYILQTKMSVEGCKRTRGRELMVDESELTYKNRGKPVEMTLAAALSEIENG
jgi:hypothetical protein